MKRPLVILKALLLAALFFFTGCEKEQGKSFENAFLSPPESTKPWVYWYWISDNISKEGITRDLEAMAEAGIGEALIGNVVDPAVPVGNVAIFTEEWWSCVEHAIAEAGRLGIKVGMFNCPGWSQSGGPWVKPEQAMRYLLSDEFRVTGPQKLSRKLDNPAGHFQPVAVQAFPVPAQDGERIGWNPGRIKATGIENIQALFDGNPDTHAKITGHPVVVDIVLPQPTTVRSLEIVPAVTPTTGTYSLAVKTAQGDWKEIIRRKIERSNTGIAIGPMVFAPMCESFEAVNGQEFRLTFEQAKGTLAEIGLSAAARLNYFAEKQLGKMSPVPDVRADSYKFPAPVEPDDPALTIDPSKVIDLTAQVGPDGMLSWEVPEGEWIVLYTGMTPTGTENAPTTDQGRGLEIDKMNKQATQYHFDSFMGELLKRIPPEKRSGLRHVVADSYEQGSENWTEGFAEQFVEVYGYDPYPFLPVLTGRIVESADRSERFLWDMRRLVADRIPSEYVGGLRERAEENGLRLWLENYGHWGFPGEFLNYGGASHDLGGEFWLSAPELGPVEVRCASSAAHIYGKPVVSAEAFTSHWTFSKMPRDLKMRGDWSWTEGINHFVLHVYIHQPDERKPGMSAWFGTDFNRHSTWFGSAKSYFDYIRRSCGVLQTGANVADVAYFIGEDVPKMTGDMEPQLPAGYDYDFLNAEVLLRDAAVENGRIALASGASYGILVLPPQSTMRPETLRKIVELVEAGATILGPPPAASPSGKNYPEADGEVRSLAAGLWGEAVAGSVTENRYGKGRVFRAIDLAEALNRLGIPADISLPADMLYTHRSGDGAEVYFVSNQQDNDRKETLSFRVAGKQPELWNPVTGEMRDLAQFSQTDTHTSIPLEFGAGDAWFIVFRNPVKSGGEGVNFPAAKPVQALPVSWQVAFRPVYAEAFETDFAGLTDWTQNDNPEIRYYSGTATYSTDFEYDGETTGQLYIDLGRVEGMATVRLNGEAYPTLWRYPYRVDVSGRLKAGKNTIEIDLVNCWWNRLVGDRQPGTTPRTWSAYVGWNEKSELLPSGLLGPVNVLRIDR